MKEKEIIVDTRESSARGIHERREGRRVRDGGEGEQAGQEREPRTKRSKSGANRVCGQHDWVIWEPEAAGREGKGSPAKEKCTHSQDWRGLG